jgi:lipoyl-dependent peroxiredoxin
VCSGAAAASGAIVRLPAPVGPDCFAASRPATPLKTAPANNKEVPMPAYTIKPLVTATAVNTGGRNGHSETTDHSVSANFSVPKAMGGPGLPNTTTPEHLFSAGYAACFGGAIEFVAHQHKKNVDGTVVTCSTSVGPREGGGFGIAVKMQVKVPTLPVEEARALVQETHEKVCPYSHATRGNIDFVLEVEGA